MINNKNFLILLISSFVYINFYQPLKIKNEKSIARLSLYNSKLKTETRLLSHQKEIEELIKTSTKKLLLNKNVLYAENTQDSTIFNNMQSTVKRLVKSNEGDVVNIIWGTPFSLEDAIYTTIPFSFIVTLTPDKLYHFLKKLFSTNKAIVIKQIFLVKKEKKIVLNMQIYLYKKRSLK